MINGVYAYYVSTYGNRVISRHDSHKRSELRDLYNNIVKLNKAAPIYKVDMSESAQKLAIDIKEAARSLTDTLSDITDITEGTAPIGIIATSDNPELVTARYIGGSTNKNGELTFDVKQLAEPQVNTGEYLSAGAKALFPGSYSFDIDNAGTVYELQFTVNDNDNNGSVLSKLARLITRSNMGLNAEVVQNEYAQRAIRITSENVGSRKGSPYQFRITENDSTQALSGAVGILGLDKVSQYPSNAVFELNGQSTVSENNIFTVDNEYEITLHGISADHGIATVASAKDGSVLEEQFDTLADSYNHLLNLSRSKDTHELRRLNSDITAVVKRYRQQLENNGITVNENYSLSSNKEALSAASGNGTIFDNLEGLRPFKDALRNKVNSIKVNPMEYINKKVVAYKNPQKLISTPYSTSIYTGMMFNELV